MKAVSFTAKDCDRLTVAIPEISDSVVVEGTFETEDPFVIAALDAHPHAERVKGARKSAPKTEAPEAATETEGDE